MVGRETGTQTRGVDSRAAGEREGEGGTGIV